jgi:hypothetical protein
MCFPSPFDPFDILDESFAPIVWDLIDHVFSPDISSLIPVSVS